MASAYKCDRCGNYYEKDKNLFNPNEIVMIKTFTRRDPYIEQLDTKDRVDVCTDCVESFINWLKMEEK